jgi:hypothetical protein
MVKLPKAPKKKSEPQRKKLQMKIRSGLKAGGNAYVAMILD